MTATPADPAGAQTVPTAPTAPAMPTMLTALPTLVVAPHLDDALLSAFELTRSATGRTVLTVFDGEPQEPVVTSWDLVCSLKDSAEAMRLRRAENDEAMRRSGCAHRSVGLVDLQYLDGPRPAEDAEAIRAAVRAWLAEVGEGIVAAPAGAGTPPAPTAALLGTPGGARRRRLRRLVGRPGQAVLNARARWMARHTLPAAHADHLFVRDAIVTMQDAAGIVLYEEIPYLWGESADRSVAELLERHALVARPITATVDRTEKARCLSAYRSQVELLYSPRGRLDSAQGLPDTERYWLLTG